MQRPAYLMIKDVLDAFGNDGNPLPLEADQTALAIAQLQVEATCAVAQATVELQAELEAIRATIANLR